MSKLTKRLGTLWRRRQLDRDIEDELAFHVAMSAKEGGDLQDAKRRFGNSTALKESCRNLWAFTSLESWGQDFRHALATLAANPTMTLVAITALALGIGANTTLFTVITSALSFDMGVDHVERLVFISPSSDAPHDGTVPQLPDFRDLNHLKSLTNMAAYRYAEVNMSDSRALPERYSSVQMTASGWSLVKRRPILGREFGEADDSW